MVKKIIPSKPPSQTSPTGPSPAASRGGNSTKKMAMNQPTMRAGAPSRPAAGPAKGRNGRPRNVA